MINGADRPIVGPIDLDIETGSIVGIAGESGSGKSFLFKSLVALNGSRAWSQGTATFKGINVAGRDPQSLDLQRRMRGSDVGFIFQQPTEKLDPIMSIGRQLVGTLRKHHDFTKREAVAKAIELLGEVGLPNPESYLSSYPHQLSGGQNQRVMIALALVGEPEILIADEPTTGLDVSVQEQILVLLQKLARLRQMAVVLVSHDLDVLARVCDQIAVLYAGRLVEFGSVASVLRAPKHPYTSRLMHTRPSITRRASLLPIPGEVPAPENRSSLCGFLSRCHVKTDLCEISAPASETKNSRVVLCHNPVKEPFGPTNFGQPKTSSSISRLSGPTLVLSEVTKTYKLARTWMTPADEKHALCKLSLTIKPGSILGIVGESGSGKTTLGRLIVGAMKPSTGTISVVGCPENAPNFPRLPLWRHAQLIYQNPSSSLDPRLTALEHVIEPLISRGALSKAERLAKAQEALLQLGITKEQMVCKPSKLSGGQLQRVAIARAIALRPAFLVCDEPTSALDVSVQANVINILLQLRDETGVGIVFISHNLAAVRAIADNVAVMKAGTMVEYDHADRLFVSPKHEYTKHLIKLARSNEAASAAASASLMSL
ncbi:dipeptide ABC transporter ATP-binding protein [Aliirhizobium smilacinae]|uniref:dipeptide ABC transporter ATP-binding protein n=1 Tax=Aliirhizobium smilacinae TaxID=1395944 RepID=UPI0015D5E77E|nr:ABC transporter ATP-binding protein [Rhizobium smilacinae]